MLERLDINTLKLATAALNYHANIHTVALACPGMDYIRLWPLVKQPWQETPDPWPGGYARK